MQHKQAPKAEGALKIPFHHTEKHREGQEPAYCGRSQSTCLGAAALSGCCSTQKYTKSNRPTNAKQVTHVPTWPEEKNSRADESQSQARPAGIASAQERIRTPVPRHLSPAFLGPLAWPLGPCSTAPRASRSAPKKYALLGTATRKHENTQVSSRRVSRATTDTSSTGWAYRHGRPTKRSENATGGSDGYQVPSHICSAPFHARGVMLKVVGD